MERVSKEFAESLVKVMNELKAVSADAENPHFRSRYASLAGIINEIKPILQKYGLAFMQSVSGEAGVVKCKTLLLYKNGEILELGDVAIPYDAGGGRNAAQAAGSAITYARRYSLAAAFGIATIDEDDDGEGAGARSSAGGGYYDESASKAQMDYLSKLRQELYDKFGDEAAHMLDEIGYVDDGLTKREASEMIEKIKKMLRG